MLTDLAMRDHHMPVVEFPDTRNPYTLIAGITQCRPCSRVDACREYGHRAHCIHVDDINRLSLLSCFG
jgi:hypothetical protein